MIYFAVATLVFSLVRRRVVGLPHLYRTSILLLLFMHELLVPVHLLKNALVLDEIEFKSIMDMRACWRTSVAEHFGHPLTDSRERRLAMPRRAQ